VSAGSNYAARVEISYTVLNSSPTTASFDKLKHKYLSAFAFNGDEDAPLYAVQPDTASTAWVTDIEIWGGMIMNNKNAVGSNDYAQTWVKNADGNQIASISTLKGPTNAFQLNYPIGIDLPRITSGSFSAGQFPSGGSINWPGIAPPGYSITWPSGGQLPSFPTIDWGGIVWASNNTNNSPATDDRKTWSLFPGGSDTEVVFFPFPIFCKGNAAGNSNMRVYTSGDADENRTTWFYRPLKTKGIDHGWV
jgi:hypothetical protein